MSIGWKILLALSATCVVFVAMARLVQRSMVQPSFERLEREEAAKDLHRSTDAVGHEQEQLSVFLRTLSAWDDTYEFAASHSPAFIASNLCTQTYTNNNLNLIWFTDAGGKLVWGQTRDSSTGAPIDLGNVQPPLLGPDHALVSFDDPSAVHTGLVATALGPMMIAARPIVTSDNKGPIRGAAIVGRLLGPAVIADMKQWTHVDTEFWLVGSDQLPDEIRPKLAQLRSDEQFMVDAPDNLHVYTVINDLGGKPLMVARDSVPRSITENGMAAMSLATISTIAAGVWVLLVTWLLLRVVVVGPLTKVTRHMVNVGKRSDLGARLGLKRGDEVGTLSREFDRMVERLAESRAQMLEAAHKAGMAEIASEVLHNVGNAMNTINVSAELLAERAKSTNLDGLAKVSKVLVEHRDDLPIYLTQDPKGQKVIQYMVAVADVLTVEHANWIAELHALQTKVEHVKDVIASQQSHAAHEPLVQREDLAKMIDEVLSMHAVQLTRLGITVRREVEGPVLLDTQKPRLMQVLVNLVKNAIESMNAKGGKDLCLTLRAKPLANRWVRVVIEDTGLGITAENATRLFRSGFSTKKTGHGIGLHYCANAVAAMGGTITASSEGLGKGASFKIDLPTATMEATVCKT